MNKLIKLFILTYFLFFINSYSNNYKFLINHRDVNTQKYAISNLNLLKLPEVPKRDVFIRTNAKSNDFYMSLPSYLSRKVFKPLTDPITKPFNYIKSVLNNSLFREIISMLYPRDNLRIRLFFIGSIIFLYLSKWYNLQVPFIYQRTIDLISVSKGLTTKVNNQITLAIVRYGLSRALSVIFSEIKTCLFTHVSQNIIKKFAVQIFTQIHLLNTEFHVLNPSGVLSVAYVRSIRGLQSLLFEIIFSVLPMFLELFLSIYLLYSRYSYPYALVTLLTFSLYMVYTVYITQFKVKIRTEMIKTDSERNAYLIDTILNHELIKLFNNYLSEINKYSSKYISKIEKLFIQTTYSVALLNLGQTLIFGIGLISMLLLAVNDLFKGKISLGELVAINAMLMQLSVPFNWVGMTYQEIREAIVDISYMSKIFSSSNQTTSTNISPISSAHLPIEKFNNSISNYLTNYLSTGQNLNELSDRTKPSQIEFRDVSFSYTNGSSILKNLSFVINPGENVAIVGPSGSGKSTALRLISRLYEPTSGNIYIDNNPIDHLSLSSLRERISVIPQDTSLFDNTIDYNIRYGNNYLDSRIDNPVGNNNELGNLLDSKIDELSTDQIKNYYNSFIYNNPNSNLATYLSTNISNHQNTYLSTHRPTYLSNDLPVNISNYLVTDMIDKVQLSDVVKRLPEGLNTMVGERGARLSGGERQKVSIARALLRQPTLILCDEMTSSIDAFSEKEIISLIKDINKKQNITVITIAHRLSSISHCDKILVINNGSLVEIGSHMELLKKNGLYHSMWLSQNYDLIDNNNLNPKITTNISAWVNINKDDSYIPDTLVSNSNVYMNSSDNYLQ